MDFVYNCTALCACERSLHSWKLFICKLMDSGIALIAYPVFFIKLDLSNSLYLVEKVEAGQIFIMIMIRFAFVIAACTHHLYCLSLDESEGA
jgi:hypothetical protein